MEAFVGLLERSSRRRIVVSSSNSSRASSEVAARLLLSPLPMKNTRVMMMEQYHKFPQHFVQLTIR